MRSLRDRLQSYHGKSATEVTPADSIGNSDGNQSAGPFSTDPTLTGQGAYSIERVIPGWEEESEAGTCFVRELRVDLLSRHGKYVFADALKGSLPTLARMCGTKDLDVEDWRRVCFFDTETGGLGTGAGNFIFLFGFAYFDEDEFCVRQYFLRDHFEESAILSSIATFFQRFEVIVSFNGRAFDWPLLQSRCTLNRCNTVPDLIHLDLLSPSRRLWKRQLANCRLSTIESEILGVERLDDVPGKRAPELYFSYRNDGDARPLADVFTHNAWDILSLCTLAHCLTHRAMMPFRDEVGPYELFGLASWYAEWELAEQSRACLTRIAERADAMDRYPRQVDGTKAGEAGEAGEASSGGAGSDTVAVDRQDSVSHVGELLRMEALWRLSLSYKRERHFEAAVELWEEMAESSYGWTTAPRVELAKYYEHRARDYEQALYHVEQALLTVHHRRRLHRSTTMSSEESELRRRQERILQKRQRSLSC